MWMGLRCQIIWIALLEVLVDVNSSSQLVSGFLSCAHLAMPSVVGHVWGNQAVAQCALGLQGRVSHQDRLLIGEIG